MATRCVLVIDDDPDIREVVQVSLALMAGWEVISAATGAEGIEIARQSRPDGILLDMMMPQMDGAATARALHEAPETRGIPIVLLTAKQQSSHRQDVILGVAAVIAKPFDPLTLHQRVSALLGWR